MYSTLQKITVMAFALGLAGVASAQDAKHVATSPASLQQSLQKFLEWAPGEYDNNEQVWQEGEDKSTTPHQHIHHIFVDAGATAIGPHTLIVQQQDGSKAENVFKVRLLSVSADQAENAVRLDMYAFKDEAKFTNVYDEPAMLAAIGPSDVALNEGCSVYLSDRGDHFEGGVKADACRIRSSKSGQEIIITDTMRLSASDLWLNDEGRDSVGKLVFGQPGGVPNKNRRVEYFSGWTIVKTAGPSAALDDQSMWSMVRLVIHNEGQIVPIKDDKTGKDTGYSLQLAQLTYQNTRNPILKLGLIDNTSGKTVTYSWASTNAEQVGTNLRWFQAGVTRRSGDAGKFGFVKTK